MVPVRWVANALDASVGWDDKNKVVTIEKLDNIWPDEIDPAAPRVLSAINVVSRYLAMMVGASGLGEYAVDDTQLTEVATSKALDLNAWGSITTGKEEKYIIQPFMLTGEHAVARFDILDVRSVGEKMEVAAQVYQVYKGETSAVYNDIVYTVVWETSTDDKGNSRKTALIDSERFIGSSNQTDRLW